MSGDPGRPNYDKYVNSLDILSPPSLPYSRSGCFAIFIRTILNNVLYGERVRSCLPCDERVLTLWTNCSNGEAITSLSRLIFQFKNTPFMTKKFDELEKNNELRCRHKRSADLRKLAQCCSVARSGIEVAWRFQCCQRTDENSPLL